MIEYTEEELENLWNWLPVKKQVEEPDPPGMAAYDISFSKGFQKGPIRKKKSFGIFGDITYGEFKAYIRDRDSFLEDIQRKKTSKYADQDSVSANNAVKFFEFMFETPLVKVPKHISDPLLRAVCLWRLELAK